MSTQKTSDARVMWENTGYQPPKKLPNHQPPNFQQPLKNKQPPSNLQQPNGQPFSNNPVADQLPSDKESLLSARNKLLFHLWYEFDMLFDCLKKICANQLKEDKRLLDAIFESACLHYRNLYDFLYGSETDAQKKGFSDTYFFSNSLLKA
jgi:hypothetical protein